MTTNTAGPHGFGGDPSSLLTRYAQWIPIGARVLDLGAGQGGNALHLAAQGCAVTALEPSPGELEILRARAAQNGADLDSVDRDFMSYEPDGLFDVITCFGVVQTLRYQDCASLVTRLHQWLRSGGTLFLTAWHTNDPSFGRYEAEWERVGIRSFVSPEGTAHRLFLEPAEVLKLFLRWQQIHHWEGLDPERQHGEVEVVLTRP